MNPSQPDDPGYEVVDDAGYEVVDSPPRKPPAARPVPAARILPAKPLPAARVAPPTDTGFDVVEEPTPRKKTRPVQDAETVEVPRSKAKTVRVRAIDDDEDDDRPRKKKRGKASAAAEEGENGVLVEWAGPVFMMVVGLLLTVVGTWGMAKGPEAAVAPVAAVGLRVAGELIAIPVTIIALMVIGSMFGIEYGTFTHAVRSLAAMGLLVSGLMDVADWARLPPFLYQPVIFLIGLGLFMTLLRLDVWEAIVTMFGLNLLSWLFQFIMVIIIIAMLSSKMKKEGRLDDGPGMRDRQGQADDWGDHGPLVDPNDDE